MCRKNVQKPEVEISATPWKYLYLNFNENEFDISKCVKYLKVTNVCKLLVLETLVIEPFFTKSVFLVDFSVGVYAIFSKSTTRYCLQRCAVSSNQPTDSISKAIFLKKFVSQAKQRGNCFQLSCLVI